MGADQSQQQQGKKIQLSVPQIKTELMKVQGFLEVRLGKRENQLNQKENQLMNMILAQNRNKEQEFQKANSCTSDANYIRACQILIRHCDILQNQSQLICKSNGRYLSVQPCFKQIESLIFASGHLDIEALNTFKNVMVNYFGTEVYSQAKTLTNVDQELQNCFINVVPTKQQTHKFFLDFCNKKGVQLNKLNEAGHEVSEQSAQEFPHLNPQNQQNCGQNPNQNQNFPPLYPQQQNQQFPQQQNQQFPQQYPQQFPQQYPQQYGFNQNQYPQQFPLQMPYQQPQQMPNHQPFNQPQQVPYQQQQQMPYQNPNNQYQQTYQFPQQPQVPQFGQNNQQNFEQNKEQIQPQNGQINQQNIPQNTAQNDQNAFQQNIPQNVNQPQNDEQKFFQATESFEAKKPDSYHAEFVETQQDPNQKWANPVQQTPQQPGPNHIIKVDFVPVTPQIPVVNNVKQPDIQKILIKDIGDLEERLQKLRDAGL